MMAGKFDDLEDMIKPFLKLMGDNLVTERPRLGGNFAIAQAIFSRSQRDMLREIVGPDLHFMVLSMTKETQDKRLKARHGDSVPKGLLDFFVKFSEKCELAGEDEPNAHNIVITEDMTKEDVVKKVLEIVAKL